MMAEAAVRQTGSGLTVEWRGAQGLKVPGLNVQGKATQPPLVLLHGWGCSSAVWGDFADQLSAAELAAVSRGVMLVNLPGFGGSPLPYDCSTDGVLQMLEETLPERSVLIGWSLGGMVATAFAARFPERVEALICLGTNASYIQRGEWDMAIPAEGLAAFRDQLRDDPTRCIKRFRASQVRNDRDEKQLLQQLHALTKEALNDDWLVMLGLLEELDNREALCHSSCRTLYLFGERDGLVPVQAAAAVARLNPAIEVQVLHGMAHVLHLTDPFQLAQRIRAFLGDIAPLPNKHQVAGSFSRSAATYDQAAYLQRSTGARLLAWLPPHLNQESFEDGLDEGFRVLDVGCGTGYFTNALAQRYGKADVLGLDIAEGMIEFARGKAVRGGKTDWLCGDAEQLPLADNSVDLLFSNLTVQWCDNLGQVASEVYRVLKPGGSGFISTLGPNTLHELRSAWEQVDGFVHVNRFLPVPQVQHHFEARPFASVDCRVEQNTTRYPHLLALLRELKALGARNMNPGRAKSMTGKGRIRQLEAAYESFRSDSHQELPATWQVVYLRVSKSRQDPAV